MEIEHGARLIKKERGPLDRFKNQNLVFNKFGMAGIRVYNAISGEKTVGDVLRETGVDESRLLEILEFMEQNGIIDIVPVHEGMPTTEEHKVERVVEEKPAEEKPRVATEPEPTETEIEEINLMPETQKPAEEVKPVERETEEEKSLATAPQAPPELPKPPKPPSVPQPPQVPPRTTGETKKEVTPEETEKTEEEKVEKVLTQPLTPIEKMIKEKFGDVGVKVYNLIDGERTAEEILKETGISEVKLIEILEFLDTQGIIKLEKPEEKPITEMEPITEVSTEIKEEPTGEGVVPVDVPVKQKLGFFKETALKFDLMKRFGPLGAKVYNLIDGKRNIVDLAIDAHTSLFKLDDILEYLGKKGAVIFKTMSREEIKEKYGEEGLTIFKKYGRDGLLVYELIGRVSSLKALQKWSQLEPERLVDIFVFIHDILNIQLPISKEAMYKQLGVKR